MSFLQASVPPVSGPYFPTQAKYLHLNLYLSLVLREPKLRRTSSGQMLWRSLWLFFFSLAVCWIRIRGLWKCPDGRDWLRGKLGLVLRASEQEGRENEKLWGHQGADRMKTTITDYYSHWSHGPQSCLTQWNHEPCCVGPPKMDRSWWRVLTKCGPLEKGMANQFSILALRTPWTVWKGKKIWHWKMNTPGQ